MEHLDIVQSSPSTRHRVAAAVRRPPAATLSGAIVAGFNASLVMLIAFAVAYGGAWLLARVLVAGGPPTDTLRQWFYGLAHNRLIDLARPHLYLAISLYFAGGLLWAVLYAYVFHSRLEGADWRRGLVFSLVPWLFSLAVFLPLLGGGFFGWALGAGPLPVLGNFILHAVYGVTLAELYGPFGDVIVDAEATDEGRTANLARTVGPPAAGIPAASSGASPDIWANRGAQIGAARGIVAGLVVGAAVGWLAIGMPEPLAGQARSVDPSAMLLAASLLGGALGALIGSLAGLSTAAPRA